MTLRDRVKAKPPEVVQVIQMMATKLMLELAVTDENIERAYAAALDEWERVYEASLAEMGKSDVEFARRIVARLRALPDSESAWPKILRGNAN